MSVIHTTEFLPLWADKPHHPTNDEDQQRGWKGWREIGNSSNRNEFVSLRSLLYHPPKTLEKKDKESLSAHVTARGEKSVYWLEQARFNEWKKRKK